MYQEFPKISFIFCDLPDASVKVITCTCMRKKKNVHILTDLYPARKKIMYVSDISGHVIPKMHFILYMWSVVNLLMDKIECIKSCCEPECCIL